jgi:MFS superfamily sulfate permease-like transporter|tara:strand:- start:7682 stop:8050 length:369 start_codon:yes stop_codon:yes gene_type:complete
MSDMNKFSGDMSRNEVELDLSKFMELLQEANTLKERIRELEDQDTRNPWQKLIFLAQAVDSWRIFPRAFLSVYIFLLYYATMWFMDLPDPTMEQSGLISVIVGAGAAWFGLYAGTSKGKTDH